MNWINQAWTFLRKLPVASWIKPVWKGLLQEAVQGAGDRLQRELDELLEKHGDAALDQANAKIDGLQARINAAIDALPLPVAWETRIKAVINGPVDRLQERLKAGCALRCAEKAQEAFDAAFDRFQEELKARIAAL